MACGGAFCVVDQAEDRALGALGHELGEQTCGVAMTTAAGIVLGVGDHHRPAGAGSELQRLAHRLAGGYRVEAEIPLSAPQIRQKPSAAASAASCVSA